MKIGKREIEEIIVRDKNGDEIICIRDDCTEVNGRYDVKFIEGDTPEEFKIKDESRKILLNQLKRLDEMAKIAPEKTILPNMVTITASMISIYQELKGENEQVKEKRIVKWKEVRGTCWDSVNG